MLSNSRSVIVATLSTTLALAAAPARAQNTADYPLLDHVQGTLVQTAAAPVRPILIDESLHVWAVNTGLSTIEHFGAIDQTPVTEAPIEVLHVPWGPVAIAEWQDPNAGVAPELLVVCRNTWGLLRINKTTGAFKEFIALPAEPSDIAVDHDLDRAFVSCTGADAVVQINLTTRDGKFHRRYDEDTTGGALRIKSPYFLSLVAGKVRVAPLHSGNNTTVTDGAFDNLTSKVIDVANRTVNLPNPPPPPAEQTTSASLPDEDLFEIDPAASLATCVSVKSKGAGTILFAHGENPGDEMHRYWLLNTDARNADPAAQNEPALNFDFVDNRITFAGTTNTFIGCDPDSGFGWDQDTAIGQPFALAFHPETGRAFVTGLLTDNVTMFDDAGGRQLEIDLLDGSIPRGLAMTAGNLSRMAVHCWGTARIEVFEIDHAAKTVTPKGGYALSDDPLPADQEEGRKIFFDGSRSARKNVSCASCHVDGGTDFLAWNLSGMPFDDKGPMVTQTLIGLERVGPFHWRGERSFEDFNTFAFPGLLGNAAPLPEADFAKMKAWLFALKNPANPYQNRKRVVDGDASLVHNGDNPAATFVAPTQTKTFRSDLTKLFDLRPGHGLVANVSGNPNPVPHDASGLDAVLGMARWRGIGPNPGLDLIFQSRWRCVQCHDFPVGTNNDLTDDESQPDPVTPERVHFKNAAFHEIWRKHQSLVPVDTTLNGNDDPSTVEVRAFLGTGVQHAGSVTDILRFAQAAGRNDADSANFAMTTASFVQQWDQGLAPAAHYGFWLNNSLSQTFITAELDTYLLKQASRSANSSTMTPNCDIVVLQYVNGSRRAWFLNRALVGSSTTIGKNDVVFTDDNDSINPNDHRNLQWFISEAKPKLTIPPITPKPSLVLGVPVGMGERFAADFDMDGKKNTDEAAGMQFTPDPVNDPTPPVITSAIGFATTNLARVFVQTDDPTTLTVFFNENPSGSERSVTSPLLSRVHALILPGLRPSTSNPVSTNIDDVSGLITSETVTYNWRIEARNASNVLGTANGATSITTGPFSIPVFRNPPSTAVTPVAQLRHEHVLTSPPVVTVGSAGPNRTVTVQLAAWMKQGPPNTAAANRVFVVRAFRIHGTDAPVLLAPGAGLLGGSSGTKIVGEVIVGLNPLAAGNRRIDLDGLIVNETPAASGSATLTFDVDGALVAAGDVVAVQVEAIVEAAASTTPTFDNCGAPSSVCEKMRIQTPADTALSQWDFPRTKEVNSQGRATAP